jgi:hypothetical protein
MPLILAFFVAVGDILFRVGLSTLTIFARATAWNIALASLTVVLIGGAITILITVLSAQASIALQGITMFPVLPMFLPSNLPACLGAYVTFKISGTVFNATLHFIQNRSYILKA